MTSATFNDSLGNNLNTQGKWTRFVKSGDFNRFFDEKGNIDVIFDLSSSLVTLDSTENWGLLFFLLFLVLLTSNFANVYEIRNQFWSLSDVNFQFQFRLTYVWFSVSIVSMSFQLSWASSLESLICCFVYWVIAVETEFMTRVYKSEAFSGIAI